MRAMLLTTVAAAALGTLPLHSFAQDRKQQSPTALESSQSPVTQQQDMKAEQSGRSAAEPNASATEDHGKNQNPSAQEELHSKNDSSHEAQPAQGAVSQNTEERSMRNPSASTEPMQPDQSKKPVRGDANPATTGTERPRQDTKRSTASDTAGPRNETPRAKHSMTGNQPPNNAATGRSAAEGGAMPAQGKEQRQGATVNLNSRQQTSVIAALRSEPVQRIDHVDFSIGVGAIIPSHVALNPLPDRIVEIVPLYRGYDFVMVRDEIIIVEPGTRRIVTILRGEGRSAATSAHRHLRVTR